MKTALKISLPESLREWVDTQVVDAGYNTTSEYFRHLVQEDQRRHRNDIDAKLLAALDSGKPIEVTEEWWDKRHQELDRRLAARKSKS